MKNTAIIILNWNGGADTINCLKSVMPYMDAEDYLFIVDNGSSDDSIEKIHQYFFDLGLALVTSKGEQLKSSFDVSKKNYLINNQKNIGFGAGNNVVLTQLTHLSNDFQYAWLLNNDTVAEKHTLSHLKKSLSQDQKIAMSGSLILNYPEDGLIQCSGVNYFKFIGVSKLVNKNCLIKDFNKDQKVHFDYLNGASMLIRLSALTRAGYFDDRFFLYSEEHDLQLRLQNKGYKLSLDCNSVIYHKLAGGTRSKKHLFYFYYNTSAVLLSKKHFSKINTFCAIFGLTAITFIRTFPSVTNFSWGIKGIIAGLKK